MNYIHNIPLIIYILLFTLLNFDDAFKIISDHMSFCSFRKRSINSILRDYEEEIEIPVPKKPTMYIGEEQSEWDGYMVITIIVAKLEFI